MGEGQPKVDFSEKSIFYGGAFAPKTRELVNA